MYRLRKDVENKYRFVTLASLRAEQLQAGARARLESTHRKPTVVAQQEVDEGLVDPWDPELAEQELAEQEAEEEA
jgi:DNA-directed RNA polymerase omega subunit